jgi:AcrR family transcriptional regulator
MTEQDTKAHILAAATAVFAQKGFAKASMNDIVRASGLSKGGVYWHFKSKDAIVETIFEQFFAGQLGMLEVVLNHVGSASEKILHLATMSGGDLEEMIEQFPSPLEFYALASRDEKLTHSLQNFLEVYQERIGTIIQQGIDEGEFRAVDAAETAVTIGAIFEGTLLLWAVNPHSIDVGRQLETAVYLLLNGLHNKEKPVR